MINSHHPSVSLKTLITRAALEKFAESEPLGDLSSREHVLMAVRVALDYAFDLTLDRVIEEMREHYRLFIEDYMSDGSSNLEEKTRIYAEGIEDAIEVISDLKKYKMSSL